MLFLQGLQKLPHSAMSTRQRTVKPVVPSLTAMFVERGNSVISLKMRHSGSRLGSGTIKDQETIQVYSIQAAEASRSEGS